MSFLLFFLWLFIIYALSSILHLHKFRRIVNVFLYEAIFFTHCTQIYCHFRAMQFLYFIILCVFSTKIYNGTSSNLVRFLLFCWRLNLLLSPSRSNETRELLNDSRFAFLSFVSAEVQFLFSASRFSIHKTDWISGLISCRNH